MKVNKVGIIGIGKWAVDCHLPYLRYQQRNGRLRLVAVSTRSIISQTTKKKFLRNINIYDDYLTLLATESLDIVVICTSDYSHFQIICDSAKAGCNIIVEKPMCLTLAQAKKIAHITKTHDVQIYTNFHKRRDPLWLNLNQRLKDPKIGNLQFGFISLRNKISVASGRYFFNSSVGENCDLLSFLGIHIFDQILWSIAEKPTSVKIEKIRGVLASKGLETEDSIKIDMGFQGINKLTVVLSWVLPESMPFLTQQSLNLQFDKTLIDIDFNSRGFREFCEKYNQPNPNFMLSGKGFYEGYGYRYLDDIYNNFFAKKGNSSEIVASVEESVDACRILDAATKSFKNGKVVKIDWR